MPNKQNMQNIYKTDRLYRICRMCRIQRQSRVQHITLFLYSVFHETNLNHQETKDGEWTQNDRIEHTDNWSILVLSLSQHLRVETWRCDDNSCRPSALSWGKPSLVFWGCRTSLLCTDCTILSPGWREPPCRAPSISRRRWSPWPWAPRCGCSAWSRPSCLERYILCIFCIFHNICIKVGLGIVTIVR